MKLFLISQDKNLGYDTYDSAVVAAPDEDTAKNMRPDTGKPIGESNRYYDDWVKDPDCVCAQYIGEAADGVDQGVICASYNAN